MNQERKKLDDVLDVGSCIKNHLSEIKSKLEDFNGFVVLSLGASTGRESGHCVADAGVSFGTVFLSLVIKITTLNTHTHITELSWYSSNLNTTSSKFFE